jgi:aryl-alcohol dehydrogenase-like predicted oxidoreductase
MQYRSLGNSGLKVSEIGLGSNNFGATTREEESISNVQYALQGRRSDFIIGTKFAGAMGDGPNDRGAFGTSLIAVRNQKT